MANTTTNHDGSAEPTYQGSSNETTDTRQVENNVSKDNDTQSCLKTIQSKMLQFGTHLSKLRLEIVAFIFTFSYVMTKISSTTMILDKVCLVHFGYPSFVCYDLDNYTTIKTAVERLATNYQLGHTLIQTAPGIVLACFIGPWSDKYGRKFPILLALVGMILDAIGSTVCAYFLETRVEYYFIPAIFTGIFGGPVAILAIVYSYASDSTPLEKRTMKYAFIEMAAGFSIPLGSTAGGWIYKFVGYPPVFFFSTGGLCLSFVWVAFLLKETRGLDNDDPWPTKLRRIFSCNTLMEGFIAATKKRPHKGRRQVILLIISMCFLMITLNSTGDINFLYVHHQFGWDNTTYSTITAIYSVVAIFLLIIVVPLMKRYKLGDPYLGLIGAVSLLGKNIGMGLSETKGIYHIANLFGLLGVCSTLAARSRISKVVTNDDLGKVFTFVAAGESLFPIFTSVFLSQIFTACLETFPGMPYIILAIFLILPVGVFCWMTCLPKMSYEDLNFTTQRAEDIHASI